MVDGKTYTVTLWDTAGQDDYDNIRWLSYPQTDLFFICYSCVNPASFHNVKNKWVLELNYRMNHPHYILVATKTELRDDPNTIQRLAEQKLTAISTEQGMALSKESVVGVNHAMFHFCNPFRFRIVEGSWINTGVTDEEEVRIWIR